MRQIRPSLQIITDYFESNLNNIQTQNDWIISLSLCSAGLQSCREEGRCLQDAALGLTLLGEQSKIRVVHTHIHTAHHSFPHLKSRCCLFLCSFNMSPKRRRLRNTIIWWEVVSGPVWPDLAPFLHVFCSLCFRHIHLLFPHFSFSLSSDEPSLLYAFSCSSKYSSACVKSLNAGGDTAATFSTVTMFSHVYIAAAKAKKYLSNPPGKHKLCSKFVNKIAWQLLVYVTHVYHKSHRTPDETMVTVLYLCSVLLPFIVFLLFSAS